MKIRYRPLPKRSRNIGMDRNSKTGQTGHDCCYLLMKAWDSDVVWQNENNAMNPSELTERFGVAALQIIAGQARPERSQSRLGSATDLCF